MSDINLIHKDINKFVTWMSIFFYKTVWLFVSIFLFSFLNGCITSQVRYTRPSYKRKSVSSAQERHVEQTVTGSRSLEKSELRHIVDSYLGAPYKYGGTTEKGMDCSGFVWRVFQRLGRNSFKRVSSARMRKLGKPVSMRNAKAGDLIFFRKWGRVGKVNHVGILMGDGTFAHASSKKGIIYTSLDDEYFKKRFAGIRRIY